jgi:hypothetical protein
MRRAVIVMAMVAFGAVGVAPARADQTPPNCTKNALSLDITKDKTLVRGGDVITYGIVVGNQGAGACNITNARIVFAVPGPNGAPGQLQVIDPSLDLPAQVAPHQIASVQYTVPPQSTALDLIAQGEVHGILHDAPNNHSADVTKTLGTTAFAPSMVLTKTGSTIGGTIPLKVTYTYTLQNTSSTFAGLPDVPVANPAVGDNLCAPLTYVAGDGNGDQLLNAGETWTYQCTKTYGAAGCYTNVANATGTVTIDNRPVGAGPATFSVCATPPKGAVKGASAGSPKRCVTLPSTRLKVRARELSTVRVRVRVGGKNIARSLVHVRGAGVSKSARTNKHGMVTFHVRPKKTGRLRISSDQCGVAARLSVKPARQVVSPALPEVTG